jgi:diguanylate cyclase (GGDEF)-like protein
MALAPLLACLVAQVIAAQPDSTPSSQIDQIDRLLERSNQIRNIQPSEALSLAEQASLSAQQVGDRLRTARALDLMGVLQRKLGRQDLAIELHLDARDLYEELDDPMGVAFCLANIGNAYRSLNDLSQALSFHLQALEIKEELGDESQIAYSLSRTGGIYGELGHYDNALADLERATMIYTRIDRQEALLPTLASLADIYAKSGEPGRALAYFRRSLKLAEETGALFGTAVILSELGPLLIKLGEPRQGLADLERSLELAQQIGSDQLRRDANLRLYEYYAGENESDAALEAYIRYSEAKDAMLNEVSLQKIRELEAFYSMESQQRRIGVLQEERHSARTIGYALVAGVLLLLVVAGAALRAYRGTRRANRILVERNQELDQARSQLGDLNRELESLSRTDSLTGLSNRRGMRERFETEVMRSRRRGKGFAIVMADVDRFKKINDRFGHAAGDRVLVAIAEVLAASTRGSDLAARWGGDEFLVMLLDTEIEFAPVFANRVRERVEDLAVDWNGERVSVTVTLGVARVDAESSFDRSLSTADELLYQGKHSGRNVVTVQS